MNDKSRRRHFRLQYCLLIAFSLWILPTPSQAKLDPLQLVLESEARHRISVLGQQCEMILQKKSGKKRVRTLATILVQDDEEGDKFWTRFASPANISGTAMLTIENKSGGDDDQWLHLPAFGKTRRIGTAEMGDRFVGSDFFYEDLRRWKVRDYTYKILGSEKIDGSACWVIESLPNTAKLRKESPYSKQHIWMRKDNLFIIKLRHFDKRQRPLKESRWKDLQPVKGKALRANKIVVRDIQRQHQTTLLTKKQEADIEIPAAFFSKHKLAKQESPMK